MDNEQLQNRILELEKQVKFLTDMYYKNNFSNLIVFDKKARFNGGIIIYGNANDVIGLFGATPVSRQAAISSPGGGTTIDIQARNAIDSIRTLLTTFGFTN